MRERRLNAAGRCAVFAAVLWSMACFGGPTAPTALPPPAGLPPAAPPAAAVPPDFPPLARPARVYVNSSLYVGLSGASRFVLYEDGTFALQFATARFGLGEYPGTYVEAGAQLSFTWQGSTVALPLQASGVLGGDTLTVTFNDVMKLNDFEDGVYTLVR